MKRRIFSALGLIFIMHSISYLQADSNNEDSGESIYQSGKLFKASEQQMLDIDNTIAIAKNNNKLALIIMGANWCHDSRSLASKLYLPEVKSTIRDNYELLFVDVGYLTKVEEVITRFGMPVIYATPTVLIIDPMTEQKINGHNMHVWRNAETISVEDTIAYFSDIAENKNILSNNKPVLNLQQQSRFVKLNQSIDAFEQKQAKKLYGAFSVIGPLLKQRNESGDAKDFYKHWTAVSKFRYKVTDDLSELRQQAIEIAKNETSNQKLVFPKYSPFEWE